MWTERFIEFDMPGRRVGSIVERLVQRSPEIARDFLRARNKLLAESGQAPEIDAGAPAPPPRDFSKMSKEDFNKLVDETMGKRR